MKSEPHTHTRNKGNLEYSDDYHEPWYVTDPSTGMTQYVEADTESTARWLAWSRWRGSAPANDSDQAEYDALEVIRVEVHS